MQLYRAIEHGQVAIHCVDTAAPSVLAQAAIQAPRHAFLDPAAAEERRTRSFESAPMSSRKARPDYGQSSLPMALNDSDQLERALLEWLYLPAEEGARRQAQWAFSALRKSAAAVALWPNSRRCVWVHGDHLSAWLSAAAEARIEPRLPKGLLPDERMEPEEALRRIALGAVRRRRGTVTADQIASETGLCAQRCTEALIGLQQEGLLCSRSEPGVYSERGADSPPRHQPVAEPA